MEFGVNTANWRRPESRWRPQWTNKQHRPNHYTSPGMYKPSFNRDNRFSVQCFRCKLPGHVVKNCNLKINNVHKKTKSLRQKDRDIRRLNEFKTRKSVCVLMPFYDVSEDELISFMPKWNTIVKSSRVPKSVNVSSESVPIFSKMQLENNQLCLELENVHNELKTAKRAMCEKDDFIIHLQQKIQENKINTETLERRMEEKVMLYDLLESQFRRTRDSALELEKQLSEAKKVRVNAQQQSLQEIIRTQKNEINQHRAMWETLEDENTDLRNDMADLQEEVEDLRRKLYNGPQYGHRPDRGGRRYNRRR